MFQVYCVALVDIEPCYMLLNLMVEILSIVEVRYTKENLH